MLLDATGYVDAVGAYGSADGFNGGVGIAPGLPVVHDLADLLPEGDFFPPSRKIIRMVFMIRRRKATVITRSVPCPRCQALEELESGKVGEAGTDPRNVDMERPGPRGEDLREKQQHHDYYNKVCAKNPTLIGT